MWGQILNLENPLIGVDNTWGLWMVCVAFACLAIYLEQTYKWASKLTGAILCLVFALALSNLGIIPMDAPVWDAVWSYVVPLAIPLLLLQVDIRKIGKDVGRIAVIFFIGAIGTSVGSLLGYILLKSHINELGGIAGMFTGTYIGGTVNFAALSSAFNVSKSMVSAATVADNLLMAVYFFILISMPSIAILRKLYKHPHIDEVEANVSDSKDKTKAASYWVRKEISLLDIAKALATSFIIVFISVVIESFMKSIIKEEMAFSLILRNLFGNKYLWITTLSMLLASFSPKYCSNIKGANEIGTFMIYLFFFVIGVPASVILIITQSPLLLVFAAIVVLVNMLFTLFFGKLLGFSIEEIIIASNANVGGPTTAAAMAVSKGWTKLIGPAMLIGTLGYVVGTYAGLIVGSILA